MSWEEVTLVQLSTGDLSLCDAEGLFFNPCNLLIDLSILLEERGVVDLDLLLDEDLLFLGADLEVL